MSSKDAPNSAGPSGESVSSASAHPRDRLPRVLGVWDASMLIVASVVGSGIFFTPAQVATLLPSAGLILLAWLVGALVSLAGAFANAELGVLFPHAGGDYVYVREGIHPAAGFLVGWLSFFGIYAGTIAALAVVFGEAVAPSLGLERRGILALGSAAILACSLLNWRGTRWAASLNNFTSVAKILALVLFVVVGPIAGGFMEHAGPSGAGAALGFDSWRDSLFEGPDEHGWLRFGQAMSPILFSYLGWNASVYVASEIRDPTRNLPRSLFLGLGLCAALYLMVNVVYFYALEPETLQAASDAGEAAARTLFGSLGGRMVAGFVLLSVLGTLNATVLVGPRIAYAMALDGHFHASADRIHGGYRTPSGAIAVQAFVSIGLVLLLESFPKALDFTVFAIVLATSADVLALFGLRRRYPDRPRAYRAWGYPWVPALYLVVNLGIGVAIAVASPRECAVTIGVLAGGLLLYGPISRAGARRIGPPGSDAG